MTHQAADFVANLFKYHPPVRPDVISLRMNAHLHEDCSNLSQRRARQVM